MALFFFVDGFTIKNTRSKHKDTDYCVCTVRLNGFVPQIPQFTYLGDRNSGTFPIELQTLHGIDLAAGDQCTFNYMIVNAGSANAVDIETALQKASVAWANGLGPASANLTSALQDAQTWFNDQLGSLLNPHGCDGMVAAEQDCLAYDDLSSIQPGQAVRYAVNHPGVRSPSGCGDNSYYTVTWGVFQTQFE